MTDAAGTRVLVDPGSFDLCNVGDVSMLQVAVARLRAHFPAAVISVFTTDPVALARHLPDTRAASHAARDAWLSDRYLLGPVHRMLPRGPARRLASWQDAIRYGAPAVFSATLRIRYQLGRRGTDVRPFLAEVDAAHLVIACGQGTLADAGWSQARTLLGTLDLASRRGKPIALMGQGLGPMRAPDALARTRAVLRRATLIALREETRSRALLDELAVDPARVVTTGDDAIELAYDARVPSLGTALGVNVRVAPLAANRRTLDGLAPLVHALAREHDAPLLPVPISFHRQGGTNDPETLRAFLHGFDDASDGGARLDTPGALISQIQRCRVLVSGAYHAAVFALAQGIPVVCLGRSDYYLDKFRGLAALFGPGCVVLEFDDPALHERLRAAVDDLWRCAPVLRGSLLAAAQRQIALGRAAYARLASEVAPRMPHDATDDPTDDREARRPVLRP